MRLNTDPWRCYARPAAKGTTCGHFNANGGVVWNGIVCCDECGCTKKASDDRRPTEETF